MNGSAVVEREPRRPIQTSLLEGYPQPPWRLSGSAGLLFGIQKLARARRLLPDLLEPVKLVSGYTSAALLAGQFKFSDTNHAPFSLLLVFGSKARMGSKRGWFLSHAVTGTHDVYSGLKEGFGICTTLAPLKFDDAKTLHLSKGQQLEASTRMQPLPLPFSRNEKSWTAFTEKDRRIHSIVIKTSSQISWAWSRFKIHRNGLIPTIPTTVGPALFSSTIDLILDTPEDIDLRGYRP